MLTTQKRTQNGSLLKWVLLLVLLALAIGISWFMTGSSLKTSFTGDTYFQLISNKDRYQVTGSGTEEMTFSVKPAGAGGGSITMKGLQIAFASIPSYLNNATVTPLLSPFTASGCSSVSSGGCTVLVVDLGGSTKTISSQTDVFKIRFNVSGTPSDDNIVFSATLSDGNNTGHTSTINGDMALTTSSTGGNSNSGPQTGTLSGTVKCGTTPISGATVRISGNSMNPMTFTTPSSGAYSLSNIPYASAYLLGVTNVAAPCQDVPNYDIVNIASPSQTKDITLAPPASCTTSNFFSACKDPSWTVGPSGCSGSSCTFYCNGTTKKIPTCNNGQCNFTDTLQSSECGFVGTGSINVTCTPNGSGSACEGATLTIDNTTYTLPSSGVYLVNNLSTTQHNLQVSKNGYLPYSTQVTVSSGQTTNVTVTLTPVPQCTTNDQCKPAGSAPYCNGMTETTSWSCTTGQCAYQTTPNSANCTDKICQNNQCVSKPGRGNNACSVDADCAQQLQNLYIITDPFNDLMIGYTIQGNKVQFTGNGSGTKTWNVRGTGGGKLDIYTGNTINYTPGTTNGEDILSMSDGSNSAYADITVRYQGTVPTFQIKTTNLVQQQGAFPLNISLGVNINDSLQLKALGEYKDPATGAITYKDVTATAIWSSSDTAIVTANSSGSIKGVKFGNTRISASLDTKTSNAITVYVNPSFASVNPPGYQAHFNPNPVAKGYSTRLWVFIDTDIGSSNVDIVSADLSNLNIAPGCSGTGSNIGNSNCNSSWAMTPAQAEGNGRWYYMTFRVPFTVADGSYDIRIQATSSDHIVDRHFTIPLRVVAQVAKGDVNGDGQVSIADAILALQVSVHRIEETDQRVNIFADVNGDGHVGLPEAIFVLNTLAH